MARCRLHLYFPPGWELGEDTVVGADAVRALGEAVQASCGRVADTLAVLTSLGWSCRLARYEVLAEKDCDRSVAMLDFLRSGLDPVALALEAAEPAPVEQAAEVSAPPTGTRSRPRRP